MLLVPIPLLSRIFPFYAFSSIIQKGRDKDVLFPSKVFHENPSLDLGLCDILDSASKGHLALMDDITKKDKNQSSAYCP